MSPPRGRSAALDADGRHLLADVVTSVGVLAGVGLAILTGLARLDPALAALVGVYVIGSGWHMIRRSVDGLMDSAPDAGHLERIRTTIAATLPAGAAYHALRARDAGQQIVIEFHLTVDGAMPVAEAHRICDLVESALKRELPGAQVTIHVEPARQDEGR